MTNPMVESRILGCCSDELCVELAGDIGLIGWPGATALKASPSADGAERRELITAVRGGQYVELAVKARTYYQKDGQPNRRGLRFAPAVLGKLAASFFGMPVLRDHASSSQNARIGTVTGGATVSEGGGDWFVHELRVVKPDAVISVLDGTIDRFSIAWAPTGPVICTAHGTDVRAPDACRCWPGDVVEIDGKEQTVEFEFQAAEGTEVSCVNVPAVKGTRIEDVRAALAAELGLVPRSAPARAAPMLPEPAVRPALAIVPPPPVPMRSEFEVALANAARALGVDENDVRRTAGLTPWIGSPATQAAPLPLPPALQAAAQILGLTEDEIRQDMIEAGELDERGYRLGRVPLSLDDALEIAAEQLGLTVEELRANAIEHGELPGPRAGAAPRAAARPGEAAAQPTQAYGAPEHNPYLAIAARELGVPLEELMANARAYGDGVNPPDVERSEPALAYNAPEHSAPEHNPYLVIAARELGIPLADLIANARTFGNGT